jgi:transcription antitermination factor NusA-like protein
MIKFYVLEFLFYACIFAAGWLIGRHESDKALDAAVRRQNKRKEMSDKISTPEKHALEVIGYAVLEKENGDYSNAREYIDHFQLSRIKILGDDIHVYMGRPGLFIGKKGEMINFITERLQKEFKNDKIKVIVHEYDYSYYLYPVDFTEWEDDHA